ncbi:hypothetical protein BD626DRAFT_497692 [Schizophyllum amplum]|uniref:Uncharacterized protein n=1 Tax=Schizophyllum amplum TaxID=97359 RepID=A0A550CCL3_9AGAR|nr:hypothetical protein BD626DRAFT_497692 [Auriculariopsis ampla]
MNVGTVRLGLFAGAKMISTLAWTQSTTTAQACSPQICSRALVIPAAHNRILVGELLKLAIGRTESQRKDSKIGVISDVTKPIFCFRC